MLVVVILLSACQSGENIGSEVMTESGSYRAISAPEQQTMLEAKDFFMVNVHTPGKATFRTQTYRCPTIRLIKIWINFRPTRMPKLWCIA